MTTIYMKSNKTHLSPKATEWGTMEWSVFRGDGDGYLDAQIRFRDCFSKPVSLDFNVGKLKNIKSRVDKIDLMIAELESFKAAYLEACKVSPFKR